MNGLSVKGLRLRHRILQSPMAGCTDLPYRRIARKFGCELAFCEMVKDRPVIEGNEETRKLLATADWDRPLGMQLVGRDPAMMAEAARRLEQQGAEVIDVNLGCPVRKIVSDGCGSALLQDPGQVGRIVEAMTTAVRLPVTIKIRVGVEPGDDRYLEVAKAAERAGAGAITVHGRTRLQQFSGVTNHEAIRAVKESVSIPVIGNGDIRCGADAERMMRETGCDGVMVARGALGNPWIYREIAARLEGREAPPPPTVRERASTLREHFALLREFYGDRPAFHIVRRVLHWYVRSSPGSRGLRERGNRVSSEAEFEAVVQDYEASENENATPPVPSELSSAG